MSDPVTYVSRDPQGFEVVNYYCAKHDEAYTEYGECPVCEVEQQDMLQAWYEQDVFERICDAFRDFFEGRQVHEYNWYGI